MTKPKQTLDPTSDPNSFLLSLWRMGQKDLAKATELSARDAQPGSIIYSMAAEAWLDKYVGEIPSVLAMKEQVRKLAIIDDPVLIVGPTGTGKELIARALHGPRNGKFEAINCTALPSELIESELFGHEEGAFTGAIKSRVGKFISAYDGTLFLDEIGDMDIVMQAKLLRALQEKEVTPLGSNKSIKTKCRIVAATNRPLSTLLGDIHFREDLYWRLSTFVIETLPLLPDRIDDMHAIMDALGGEDIMTLFDKLPTMLAGIDDIKTPKEQIYHAVFGGLSGNVRELQSIIRRYKILGELPLNLKQ